MARADGEGSVYRRSRDGKWVAAVSVRDPGTGERRRVTAVRRTQREAREAMRALQGRVESGAPMRDSRVTLEAWTKHWAATVLPASGRRATTVDTYRTLVRSCVLPHLGGVALADLRPSDVEGWLVTLDEAGRWSASTRRQSLTVLRAVLDGAVRDGLMATNPASDVTRPKVARTEAAHYSPAQVATVLQAAEGHRLAPLWRVMVTTGLRRGEALALGWQHVDLEARELRVRGTLVRTGGHLVVQPPKTANGWRTIPLSTSAAEALRAQRRQQATERLAAGPSWIDTGHVFTTEAGTPLDPRNVSRAFETLARQADVGGSLHTLRHTALTAMAVAGVPLSVVSRTAGHESITTTVDLYGHVSEEASRDAVELLSAHLGLSG
ncbi:tyrosine-type recombinase/integrase [Isoptericola sp. NPDC019693]|uniref:tyrosine-type recombinase/integrase n=1 Tax=Isoptericola sp. NPDC019693 TaxID=3364009 RepID=UPI00379E1632